MLTWPNIAPPDFDNFDEDHPDQTISSTSESGYRTSRPRTTRMPGTWTLGWSMLSNDDYETLLAFWQSTHGTSEIFIWVHPKRGTTHTARFATKSKFKINEYGWAGTIGIEEV